VHLSRLAERHPDKPAVIEAATGAVTTYRELDEASLRLARLLADRGLAPGDHAALFMDNTPGYFVAAWACQRSGLCWTPVNHHLTADEAAYIVRDCGARALIASAGLGGPAWEIAGDAPGLAVRLIDGDGEPPEGFENLAETIASLPAEAREGEIEGYYMFYSSGTTGRPKGILPELSGDPFGTGLKIDHTMPALFGFGPDTVYLCPAPLYHAAPTGWTLGTMRNGGTVVLMDRFDAEQALANIERYKVTHAQFVPTMLIRMLKLPEETRTRYDLSSLRTVVHAGSSNGSGPWCTSTTPAARATASSSSIPRTGSPTPARSADPRSARRTSLTTRAANCLPARSAPSGSRAGRRSATTTTPPRQPGRTTTGAGARSATWADWTPTATSTWWTAGST
jgi:acyl-CoA synthetase (AMP-forming)/AMP-acid ligase II